MSGEQAETTALSGGVEQLCAQLRDVVETIRRSGGGVVLENFPGALQAEPETDELDRPDPGRGRATPDAVAGAKRALVDAADELAETLAQLEGTAWRIHPLRARPQ